jgi:hypothetical protein
MIEEVAYKIRKVWINVEAHAMLLRKLQITKHRNPKLNVQKHCETEKRERERERGRAHEGRSTVDCHSRSRSAHLPL